MISYSVQPRGRLFLKDYGFLSYAKKKKKENKRVKILVKI